MRRRQQESRDWAAALKNVQAEATARPPAAGLLRAQEAAVARVQAMLGTVDAAAVERRMQDRLRSRGLVSELPPEPEPEPARDVDATRPVAPVSLRWASRALPVHQLIAAGLQNALDWLASVPRAHR
jgi:hypothetical protein